MPLDDYGFGPFGWVGDRFGLTWQLGLASAYRLTPQEMIASFFVVDWVEADDTAPKQLAARFTTPAGDPQLIPA